MNKDLILDAVVNNNLESIDDFINEIDKLKSLSEITHKKLFDEILFKSIHLNKKEIVKKLFKSKHLIHFFKESSLKVINSEHLISVASHDVNHNNAQYGFNIFHLLAIMGNEFQINFNNRRMIKKKLTEMDYFGSTALHYAVSCNNIKLMQTYLEHAADKIFIKDYHSNTPIDLAIASSNINAINLLLSFAVDLTIFDKYMIFCSVIQINSKIANRVINSHYFKRHAEYFLLISAYRSDLKILNFLISNGISFTSKDVNGNNALYLAASQGNVKIIYSLHSFEMIEYITEEDFIKSFMIASEKNHNNVINFFLNNKTYQNMIQKCLIHAAINSHIEALKFCINSIELFSCSTIAIALSELIKNENEDSIDLLLENQIVKRNLRKILYRSIKYDLLNNIEFLKNSNYIDLEKEIISNNLTHYCAQFGGLLIMKFLLDQYQLINNITTDSEILYYASYNESTTNLEYLLNKYVFNINLKKMNIDNCTLLNKLNELGYEVEFNDDNSENCDIVIGFQKAQQNNLLSSFSEAVKRKNRPYEEESCSNNDDLSEFSHIKRIKENNSQFSTNQYY